MGSHLSKNISSTFGVLGCNSSFLSNLGCRDVSKSPSVSFMTPVKCSGDMWAGPAFLACQSGDNLPLAALCCLVTTQIYESYMNYRENES